MSRRVPARFLGAFKVGHRASVREFIDEDTAWALLKRVEDSNYQDTTALQALEFITRFNNEFYKGVIKKNDPQALHATPAQYKAITDQHNARRRCTPSGLVVSLHCEVDGQQRDFVLVGTGSADPHETMTELLAAKWSGLIEEEFHS